MQTNLPLKQLTSSVTIFLLASLPPDICLTVLNYTFSTVILPYQKKKEKKDCQYFHEIHVYNNSMYTCFHLIKQLLIFYSTNVAF